MKKQLVFLCLIIFFANTAIVQKYPITADILRQTYIIETDTQQGTCFLVNINNQEYLITAKHLFKSNLLNGDSTTINIYQEDKYYKLKVQYFIHTDNSLDIAVLKLTKSIQIMIPFSIDGNVTLGQDIYFLGFPKLDSHQFYTTSKIGILPLVKSGIISGWINTGQYCLYFLDGHNNPGFSGGPVVCFDNSSSKPVIFGVISGYYYENKLVQKNNKSIDSTYIQENSGIIKCFPTSIVKQIIYNIK
ncbi:MAG: trypsin-like peptidase domain-containing protein [Saprospiraceae bacterium]|nr:trypsin-like peptidase domain-containing protein [Saprospiraceae bacterium]MBK7737355.1 trypsin-like peptidase domain-containing protein [Saprospiraceae bacterium]MBK7914065.1 trypsin-like peptidase domain-containing protein [Saprospiraceae bacterium]